MPTMATSPKTKGDIHHLLTTLRKSTAPYLPPPLLQTIHAADTYLHIHHPSVANDYLASEPTAALASSLFLAWIVWRSLLSLHYFFHRAGSGDSSVGWGLFGRSTAHLTGEQGDGIHGGVLTLLGKHANRAGVAMGKKGGRDERETSSSSKLGRYEPPFQETVVICGASGSGKTALLHYLCCRNTAEISWVPPVTVTSLVANVGYLAESNYGRDDSDDAAITNGGSDSSNERDKIAVRIIDYPGHPSLNTQLPTLLIPSTTSRLVFAFDATQSVVEGVSLLYKSILIHSQVCQSWKRSGKKLVILVVCTKSDEKGAKNHKRMKIQVRNELDRLRKVDLALANGGSNGENNNHGRNGAVKLEVKGKTIDLEHLGDDIPVSLHFMETGFCDLAGLNAVREFVANGTLPKLK
mmetsp:Transcript_5656/g.11708  ORF Transcript_5656/g.11708 Transcript_5656/m.11708 type:complete len:409 (+) Transcript_5656:60-1286(+)